MSTIKFTSQIAKYNGNSHSTNYARLIKGIQISWFGGVVGAAYHKIDCYASTKKGIGTR